MSDGVTIDAPDLRKVVRQIRQANVEAAKELRREFRRIGNVVLADARNNARTNLPSRLAGKAAGSLRLSVDSDRVGISFKNAGPGERGQIARVFEIGSARNRGHIRHPAWPRPGTNRGDWTWLPKTGRQSTRPSVQPAIDKNRDFAARELQRAIETAMSKAGIWGSVKFRA